MDAISANIDAINGKPLVCSLIGLFSNSNSVEVLAWGERIQVWAGEWEFVAFVLDWDGNATCYWESNVEIIFHLDW